MDACECLIVGGGPAGSSCAWALIRGGLDVAILDKHAFPRDKVCGGWITPQVIEELQIDLSDYSRGRILQPITGFRVGCIGDRITETHFDEPVSYGIRRFEFDHYLVKRSGAAPLEGVPFHTVERRGDGWIVNGEIRTRMMIGAGGHFCPVARHLNPGTTGEVIVAAQEAEFEMTRAQRKSCAIQGEVPELYFCRDLRGYGWCFRKGDFLNVGFGRLDSHRLSRHVANFLAFLRQTKRLGFELSAKLLGHAYLLYRKTQRKIVDDRVLLIGDAAGLAYSQSGEGIRPAIESGLLAAKTLLGANGDYGSESLERYRGLLAERFGSRQDWSTRIGAKLPPPFMSSLGRLLFATPWFSRRVVVDKWFLHSGEPALEAAPESVAVS
jgi:flavin-dependent dehydrogenase